MNEAWFFVGVLVFIFVVWIAIGGPTRGIALSMPTLPHVEGATTSASRWSSFTLPHAPFAIGTTEIHLPDSSEGSFREDHSSNPTPFPLVPGVTFPATSPYRGIVSLSSSVNNASSSDTRMEYVRISVAGNATAAVDITGWTLKSGATSRSERVPRGTAVPTSGIVNAASDILLRVGDEAIIVSGESPVGASFRENKCIGYFGSFQTFTPALSRDCPSAEDELAASYGRPYIHDPDCIDYADSLGSCRVPTRPGVKGLTLTCQEFLDTYLNYNGCVAAHEHDADFVGATWRIYLSRDDDEPLWRDRHEVVELLDKSGKLVDTFSY